ncbi:hypothetical protein JX265_005281 [Neoarthrinium moseri]|uniref:Uncharacterized protein n=1 Tax=Neoarthrinium moseri TaxID=1658444 RepID=A0A9P9WPW9_9PEZI|nr:hypothetical protein JX266_008515 [Neoarthrinium moseri]KAI1873659.1 hypothetical protein JX265_005281 [Neoarthrinium moseri]
MALHFLATLALLALDASAAVTVRKTGRAPTGYEVDFSYTNTTASRVLIGGGLQLFTDEFHTTLTSSGGFDPRDYRPGDFYVGSFGGPRDRAWPYEMVRSSGDDGLWTFTTPLPSGIYSFAYLVDCDNPFACSIDTGQLVIDPDLPPYRNVQGDQVASSFQVPYDAQFQGTPTIDLNFDYALSAPAGSRGTIKPVNYTSPGSIHPAPDVHEFSVYLPAEYGSVAGKKYPLLYLSHGAGGNGDDWENLGRMSAIMDNLIRGGLLDPTVVVMPSFYNLDSSLPKFIYGNMSNFAPIPDPAAIRENYQKYLFPWVQDHYDVCDEPGCRGFAGLSWGGRLTYEMYINATDYFGYFGLFSPATSAPLLDNGTLAANPALADRGVFVTYGLYDFVFDAGRELQGALDGLGIEYLSRVTPFGSHYWNTWQDALWWFGQKVLWKPLPVTRR